ncbi:ribonuclease PH [Nannocystis sp.]|uniref:ribonuclease PH n=1 Tax=Nannocystis sp. TaxID=1962667 RepID=UPI0025DCB56B|nr:ribonuclease PH [Nannocystis sp.]MBK7823823.1 ribonuclease PH [Nannocystis sp.]
MRSDGRRPDELRPFSIEPGFIGSALGSALVTAGGTRVICTASQEARPPAWLKEGGWVTAEYAMLPGSVRPRGRRESGGREKEIQRLIGRSLRAAIELAGLIGPAGPVSLVVDCDVIEADGGTRTAAITGGYVALFLAVQALLRQGSLLQAPTLRPVAAVSVGIVEGADGVARALLDLPYAEDSRAAVDLNVVMLASGGLIEVQGTGERSSFSRAQLDVMLDLAERGVASLAEVQRAAIGAGR